MDQEQNTAAAKRYLLESIAGRTDDLALSDDCIFWNAMVGDIPKSKALKLAKKATRVFREPQIITLGTITAQDNRVAIEAQTEGVLVNGARYENHYHFLFLFNDEGQIQRINEHLDTKKLCDLLVPLL
jgi:ketosteroid isomerase-like protein